MRDFAPLEEHFRGVGFVRKSVVAKFTTAAAVGKSYDTNYYNLDVIISVGYRVKSHRCKTGVGATQEINIARRNINKFGQQLG
ncbi:RhuM family protein [uncultured Alistipes sp.]|uniref:RhuM family protein n=1 Tax=uncultured Alistipes sp. TaxID=538949 RepID=UPI0025E6C483|nr:RhuM family protein [uncultured Alistipes sp.]